MAKETENKDLNHTDILRAYQILLKSPELGYIMVAKHENNIVGSLMVTYELDVLKNKLIHWI
jgi:hypothetical protein